MKKNPARGQKRVLAVIHEEIQHPTGVLDLGNLGLTTLPNPLLDHGVLQGLRHLKVLRLGLSFPDPETPLGRRACARSGPQTESRR